jgi:hypothetical protein
VLRPPIEHTVVVGPLRVGKEPGIIVQSPAVACGIHTLHESATTFDLDQVPEASSVAESISDNYKTA